MVNAITIAVTAIAASRAYCCKPDFSHQYEDVAMVWFTSARYDATLNYIQRIKLNDNGII